jgi:AraC-like DNA-binding protein
VQQTIYRPEPPLDRVVDFLWVSGAYQAQTWRERVLPTGAEALVIHFGERPIEIYANDGTPEVAHFYDAVMCGVRSTPLVIGTSLGPTVGVRFKPGGARPFFDVPGHALVQQVVSLEALCGSAALSLRERLTRVSPSAERVCILQDFLIARARRSFDLSPALSESLLAFEDPSLPSIAEVNRQTGLSPKRLIALFRDEIGLNPKAYWRVQRFRAALRNLERGSMNGATLANEHGYSDQAHFLREFRAFAGLSPRGYLAARVVANDHVAVSGKNIQYAAPPPSLPFPT